MESTKQARLYVASLKTFEYDLAMCGNFALMAEVIKEGWQTGDENRSGVKAECKKIIDKNNDLSKDPNSNRNFISSSVEAKSRMYQMGHTSESSAKPYVERHIRNKTNKLVLEEQEELQRLITESQKIEDMNE